MVVDLGLAFQFLVLNLKIFDKHLNFLETLIFITGAEFLVVLVMPGLQKIYLRPHLSENKNSTHL